MEVLFSSRRLRDTCASEREMVRQFGAVRARRVALRLQQLRVAETLDDLRAMTGRCHLLGGDRSGSLALDLDGPYRLIFRPAEWLEDASGRLDWTGVKSVVVLEITNYH